MEHLHNSLRRERHHPQHHHHHHFEPEQCEMEEWHQQLDLEDHIRRCQCSCNHMGYGNYWSYKDDLDKIGCERSGHGTVLQQTSHQPVRKSVSYSSWDHSNPETTAYSIYNQHHMNGGPVGVLVRTPDGNHQHHYHHQDPVEHQTYAHHPPFSGKPSAISEARSPFVSAAKGPGISWPAHPLTPQNGGVIGTTAILNSDPISRSSTNDILEDRDDADSIRSRSPPIKFSELGGKQWGILCVALLVALGTGVGVGVPLALRSGGSSLQERLNVAHALLAQVPLIDGHNDLPWNIRKFASGKLNLLRSLETGLQSQEPWSKSSWSHTDLPRLREGRLGAQFWSAYVPCGAQYLDAVKQTLEQIDLIKRMVDRYPHYLRLALDAQGIEDAHRDGRIASLLGVEGGHSLGNSMGVLRAYYDLGIRYVTLTHTCDTPWADCSVTEADPQRSRNGGLTPFGKLMIKEMNRLGVIVDLSHTSSATMHQTLDVSRSPVIFSHSATRAFCNITRNVPDDVLKRLVTNGGVVMVSFFSYFVSCNKTTTIQDVIAHINHVRKVAGVDHVGIGAGFDGINTTPQGLEDVSKYPNLFAELLLDPTWSEEDLKKLAGHNLLRVLREVEKVRDEQAGGLAEESCITVEELKGQTHCVYQERSAAQASVT